MANRIDGNAAGASARAAEEAARRAAEEAARKAAEEATRKALEQLRKLTEGLAQKAAAPPGAARDAFERAPRTTGTATPTGTPPEAQPTTLLTEHARDGQANCLDLVGDWLSLATPQLRGRAEVLFLRDTRPGAESAAGHVVIRQGNSIYDPTTKESFPSFNAYNASRGGAYRPAGAVSGSAVHAILSAPPGSA
ncbi:hypothetical protein ACLESO_10900, partial [Pyxidicoccus sp. 3LG]